MKFYYGPHIPLEDTLLETVSKMKHSNFTCIQVFFGSPLTYQVRRFTGESLHKTREFLQTQDKKLFVHSPYVINLASNDTSILSQGKKAIQKILDIQGEIDTKRTGTVLHIGAKGTIQNVVNHINDLQISSSLYLENCAQNSKLGKNMEELRKLKEGIDSHDVGFCLDTCHLHSSGMCNMKDSNNIDKLFEELDSFGGNKKLIFHLNDSKTQFRSYRDLHDIVGHGTIWDYENPSSFDSLYTLRDYCKEGGYDIIFETPSQNIQFEIDLLLGFKS